MFQSFGGNVGETQFQFIPPSYTGVRGPAQGGFRQTEPRNHKQALHFINWIASVANLVKKKKRRKNI